MLHYLSFTQMPPTHAAPLSLGVEMGGASPAGGFVMRLMTVGMELTSCWKPAVRGYQRPPTFLGVLKNKQALTTSSYDVNWEEPSELEVANLPPLELL